MIRFDEFTFSLPRLWAAVGLLLLFDIFCLGLSFSSQIVLSINGLLPRFLVVSIFLTGPIVAPALCLIVVVLGVIYHGWRGLWLLLPGVLVLPATFMQLIVWACAVHGQCL